MSQNRIVKTTEYEPGKVIIEVVDLDGCTHNLDVLKSELELYENGELIQRAFPNMNADHRELIISGIPPGSWDELFDQDE
jgi:hypothetical protein